VQPFVYRRYLDYGMLDAMRDLHARISEAATRRRKADDIKVGSGGIREIEFVAQLHQMVRGGRDAGLRTTSTREALDVIAERGLVEPRRVEDLRAAYAYLRKLEHRLQYFDDQQTQALPREEEHRALIAESMSQRDWPSLEAELGGHRARVQEAFNALFESQAPEPSARLAAWLIDPQAPPDEEGLAEDLAAAGIKDTSEVARALIEFTRSRRYRALSPNVRIRLEKLLPSFVDAVAGGRRPARDRRAASRAVRGDRPARGVLRAAPRESRGAAARRAARLAQRLGGTAPRAPSDPAGRAHAQLRQLPRHRLARGARAARARVRDPRRGRGAPARPPAPLQAAPRVALHHRRRGRRAAGDGALRRALGARRHGPRRRPRDGRG
jgi:hypothetical protein